MSANSSRPHRLLIVDDEYSILQGFALALQSTPWEIETESNPIQALHRLQTESFEGMILDLYMPEMDGLTMAKKQAEMGVFCPTILASAMATTDNVLAGARVGIVDFLSKPIEIGELRLAAEHLLWRRTKFCDLSTSQIMKLPISERYEAAKFQIQKRDFVSASQILESSLREQSDTDTEMLLALVAEVESRYEEAEKHYGHRLLH